MKSTELSILLTNIDSNYNNIMSQFELYEETEDEDLNFSEDGNLQDSIEILELSILNLKNAMGISHKTTFNTIQQTQLDIANHRRRIIPEDLP